MSLETRKAIGTFTAVSLGYLLQRTELFDIAPGASTALILESGAATKSQITPAINFDTRDNPFLSRRGTRVFFGPYLAGGFLGGDTQIYGFNLEVAHFIHLPKDTILQLQGQIATVDTWGDGHLVPIYDKLFLGGSNDLRGFDFRDVSPRDINGEPLGGKSLARFTVEYTVPIIEKARAAVFYDTGYVNAESWNFNTNHLVSDIGVGLRLDLPIGPIRIDYAIPIEKDVYGGGGKFNFNVGYQF
jgi:outer membrane protein insertion porin family